MKKLKLIWLIPISIIFVLGCTSTNDLSKNTLHAEVLLGYDQDNNVDPTNPSYYYVYIKNTDNYSWYNVSIILDDTYFCFPSKYLAPSEWEINYVTGCFDNESKAMPDMKPSKVEILTNEGNGVWQLDNTSLTNIIGVYNSVKVNVEVKK